MSITELDLETVASPTVRGLACKHCPAVTRSSLDVARLDGWRMFKGESVTGKQLDDVVCPSCAGTAKPEPESAGLDKSWRVRCASCGWEFSEDWEPGDDIVADAASAKSVANDHTCDREMYVAPPSSDKWMKPYDINKDGSIKPPRAGLT